MAHKKDVTYKGEVFHVVYDYSVVDYKVINKIEIKNGTEEVLYSRAFYDAIDDIHNMIKIVLDEYLAHLEEVAKSVSLHGYFESVWDGNLDIYLEEHNAID
jgi:hypothetical protein